MSINRLIHAGNLVRLVCLFFLAFSIWLVVNRLLVPEPGSNLAADLIVNGRGLYYLLILVGLGSAYALFLLLRRKAVYVIVAALGTFHVVANPYFSGIDEGHHFFNVQFMVRHHRLPTLEDPIDDEMAALLTHSYPERSESRPEAMGMPGRMYEAFQPPGYYLVAAVVYALIPGDAVARLYGLRFFGLALLLASTFVLERTYLRLVTRGGFARNDHVFFCVATSLLASPGMLMRSTAISNGHLLVFLYSLLFYLVIRLHGSPRLRTGHTVLVTVLAAAIVLTQLTAWHAVLLVAVLPVLHRQWRQLAMAAALGALLIAPWCLFNLHHYGAVTANRAAQEMQRRYINPEGKTYGLTYLLDRSTLLLTTYWLPQDTLVCAAGMPGQMLLSFLNVMMVLAVACTLILMVRIATRRWRHGTRGPPDGSVERGVAVLAVVACLAGLGGVTVLCDWDIWIGRYMYAVTLPLFLILYDFVNAGRRIQTQALGAVVILTTVVLAANHAILVCSLGTRLP